MAPVEGFSCVRYGTDTIEYQAQIGDAIYVVENELYWQGWTARVFNESGSLLHILYPEDVKGFRAWRLPAGRYRLVATYHTPHWNWGVAVSAVGMMLWAGLTVSANIESLRFRLRDRRNFREGKPA